MVVAAEVVATPEQQVHLDEAVVVDDVLEPVDAAHAGRRSVRVHCSISRPSPTFTQARLRG